jgi:hypothetical protein
VVATALAPTAADVDRQALEAELQRIRQRLSDGYQKIDQAMADGHSVERWEDLWISLLHDYEELYDRLFN